MKILYGRTGLSLSVLISARILEDDAGPGDAMQVFAVFDVSNPEVVSRNLQLFHMGNFFVTNNTFFVAASGTTTRQLAESIGFADGGGVNQGIVISVSSYWGRHDPELWEWIAAQMAR